MIKTSPSFAALSQSANDSWTQDPPSGIGNAVDGNAVNRDGVNGNTVKLSVDVDDEPIDCRVEIFALRQQLWVLLLVPVLLVLLFKPADQQASIAEHSEWLALPSMSLRFPGHTDERLSDAQMPPASTGLLHERYRCKAHFDTPMRSAWHCAAPVRKLMARKLEHQSATALMAGG